MYLIGKSPEEDGDDDATPDLRHDVEEAEAPYTAPELRWPWGG